MKYRAKELITFWPSDNGLHCTNMGSLTQGEIMSHFEPIDEPEEIEEVEELRGGALFNDVIHKLNEVTRAVNALRRKE